MDGGRVRPSYRKGRYGIAPPTAPDTIAISVLQIKLPHNTIDRWHPRRFQPNGVSVKRQGDDHCRSDPSQCIASWQKTFCSAHKGERCTPPSAALVWWEGAIGTANNSSLCSSY